MEAWTTLQPSRIKEQGSRVLTILAVVWNVGGLALLSSPYGGVAIFGAPLWLFFGICFIVLAVRSRRTSPLPMPTVRIRPGELRAGQTFEVDWTAPGPVETVDVQLLCERVTGGPVRGAATLDFLVDQALASGHTGSQGTCQATLPEQVPISGEAPDPRRQEGGFVPYYRDANVQWQLWVTVHVRNGVARREIYPLTVR